MNVLSSIASQTENEVAAERITNLKRAVQKKIRRLVEVRRQRLHVEEELTQRTREMSERLKFILKKSAVVDALEEMAEPLQEEAHLSEQLNGQSAADRDQENLQERSQRAMNKKRSVEAKILEVKQRLAEVDARTVAIQDLILASTSKSETNQVDQ